MDVTEIRRQQRQERIDGEARAIPVDESADRKAMTLMPRAA
jgi:hypothetical protein